MNRIPFILLVGVLALILVACGGQAAEAEFTIEMTEFAYSPETIEVSVGQEVTLHIVNHGALAHEVMIGREVVMEDGHPVNFVHNMFEKNEPMIMGADEHQDEAEHEEGDEHSENMEAHEGEDPHAEDTHSEGDDSHGEGEHGGEDHGFMVSLPAGDEDQISSITFTVTEDMVGEWKIGCFLDEGTHYTAGMVGDFIVRR